MTVLQPRSLVLNLLETKAASDFILKVVERELSSVVISDFCLEYWSLGNISCDFGISWTC